MKRKVLSRKNQGYIRLDSKFYFDRRLDSLAGQVVEIYISSNGFYVGQKNNTVCSFLWNNEVNEVNK